MKSNPLKVNAGESVREYCQLQQTATVCHVAMRVQIHILPIVAALFLFVLQERSLRRGVCDTSLPAQDCINQTLYFPGGCRHKSLLNPNQIG
jgi:hypothetical protein